MRYKLVLSTEIEKEYKDAVSWYDNISLSLGDDLHKVFLEELESIGSTPLVYQKRYRNIRVAFLQRFPYGIHFIFEDEVVQVLKFLHTKQLYK